MNRIKITAALTASLLAIIAGCTGAEKSQYASISPEGWCYGDTLTLIPQLPLDADTVDSGNLQIVVRHTNSYEYSNLWLRIDYATPDTTATDTINVRLADDYGNWLGQGIGVSYQRSFPALEDVTIDLSQPIKVTHIMRVDTLADIEQIGVVFTPKAL